MRLITLSVLVCRHWIAIDWRSSHVGPAGGNRRRIDGFCFHSKVCTKLFIFSLAFANCFHFRGVFQALVERHFPSSDDTTSGRTTRKAASEALFFDEEDDLFGEKSDKGAWKRKRKNYLFFILSLL